MSEFRTWGDGGNRTAEHVIEDISFADDYVLCLCGARLSSGPYLALDRAWDAHRGAEYKPPRLGQLATDDEVHEFLRRVEEPQHQSALAGSYGVTRPGTDLEDAFILLDRLMEERSGGTQE